jgi:hypothetical protein
MMFRYKYLLFVLLIALSIVACGGSAAPTSQPNVSSSSASSSAQEEVPATTGEDTSGDDIVTEVTEPNATPTDLPEPAAAPTEEPTVAPTDTPEPPQTANLGDLVEQDGYSLVAVTLEDPAPPGILYSPTEGTKLVAVEVAIGNVSGERVTVNPLNSTLIDSEGFAYTAELAGRDDQLILVDLKPGERVKGWVAFKIPEASEADIIKYEITGFPLLVLQSGLKTVDGESVANSDVPITAAGNVEREVSSTLGESVENDGYSLVAETVEDPTTPGILYTPTEGRKLIAVEIVVGNESGELITVNPLNATLVDTDGYVYAAETGGRDGQIELVDLNPGERVKGWVAFVVPEDSKPESIIYMVSGFPLIELQAGLSE